MVGRTVKTGFSHRHSLICYIDYRLINTSSTCHVDKFKSPHDVIVCFTNTYDWSKAAGSFA